MQPCSLVHLLTLSLSELGATYLGSGVIWYLCFWSVIFRIIWGVRLLNLNALTNIGKLVRLYISQMQQDIIIKFCVVGEPSVGKTSMLYQYVHHKFDQKVRPTIGCDFLAKLKSTIDGKPIRLQLWDIAGQERFNAVSKMYLRGALGCIVVCSSTERATLQQTIKWKKLIQENVDIGSEASIPCLLVQNKSDLIDNEHPQTHQTKKFLEEFARSNDFCGFMQCSAKENKNIDEIFQKLLDQTIKRGIVKGSTSPQKSAPQKPSENIVLKKQDALTTTKKDKKCC